MLDLGEICGRLFPTKATKRARPSAAVPDRGMEVECGAGGCLPLRLAPAGTRFRRC